MRGERGGAVGRGRGDEGPKRLAQEAGVDGGGGAGAREHVRDAAGGGGAGGPSRVHEAVGGGGGPRRHLGFKGGPLGFGLRGRGGGGDSGGGPHGQ